MSKGYALITGAIGGLGTAMTKRLVANGIPVIGCDRKTPAELEAWRQQALTPEEAAKVTLFPLDVTKDEQVDDLAAELKNRNMHVAYLVNNAGIQGYGKPWELDTKTHDRVIKVNINGTFFCSRAFSKAMVDAGFGRIVNFASLAAYTPPAGQACYAAAKAGVLGYTHSIALDLAQYGVTANAIAPGLIMHEGLKGVMPDHVYEAMLKLVPMRRAGKPHEIAATVAFLLSDDSSYITGQTFHVNGGLYIPG
ncbi:MAG: SDR family oxidoreductase [Porticoccaceae bacterium]|nr:MAG: SDR family oxidoreductase [Porticoccaceae bacterium]